MGTGVRIRRSLTDIQAEYDAGNKAPLETLMRAWKGLKELPPSDPNSFFALAGFHGEPFRGKGRTDGAWWGGYCQHGTVLFPTWHRVYLYKLEKALQSIPGCADVMMPYWDELSAESKMDGIPRALTSAHFELDGVTIDNPLRSFVLPVRIDDLVGDDNKLDPNSPSYSKPEGYETVRYPLSGLVGTPADREFTTKHNAGFPDYDANVKTLDANIMAWLKLTVTSGGVARGLIAEKYEKSLDAPNYSLFSNSTSTEHWNRAHPQDLVTALESPHNFMHLAIGGFDVPVYGASSITGANGDMGENDTAALDPIFYFHHCFVDYAFWVWQRRNGATHGFAIDSEDPGAAYVQQAGANNLPPADADPNEKLSMNTALWPFIREGSTPFTSADCVNIESQLNYTYGPGSLDRFIQRGMKIDTVADGRSEQKLTIHVADIDRSKIAGSFLVTAYVEVNGVHELVGIEPVLSRWNIGGCSNCQTHLKVSRDFAVPEKLLQAGSAAALLQTRFGVIGDAPRSMSSAGLLFSKADRPDVPFTVEVR